ncbi:hypothetical protein D3C76_1800200 [compost metagenome]
MKALVAVWLWILDVVFDLQYTQITLVAQHILNAIDIRDKGTCNPYPGDILDILLDALKC